MSAEYAGPVPHWYAVYTRGARERAYNNLKAWNVETLLPHKRSSLQLHHRLTHLRCRMFPRYLFARFRAGRLLHKVSFERCKAGGEFRGLHAHSR
jgi:hypothetical protein